MAKASSSFFGPSDRALEFGAKYGEVLARWGELFAAASTLVKTNVELGQLTADGAKEFDAWLKQTANAPWNLLNPDMLQRFMQGIGGTKPGA
ncbi:MAG: hypothetical protein HYX53_04860 [Chloroflexi bacterium]|nr:hypothetical protein [Chloroflexota bacterium]